MEIENIPMDWLIHFFKLQGRPIHYQHSIGSPSLSEANHQAEESQKNSYPITENSENKNVTLD